MMSSSAKFLPPATIIITDASSSSSVRTSASATDWSTSDEEALFEQLDVSFPKRNTANKRADAIRRRHAISRELRHNMNSFKRQTSSVSAAAAGDEAIHHDAISVNESLKAMEGVVLIMQSRAIE
jgi:hypothetical protein